MSAANNLVSTFQGQFAVRPLQPSIGAEIRGVDLRQPISDAIRDEIKLTLLKYKVVFFRDQELTADEHATFAARFGRLYTHPNTTRDDKIRADPQDRCVGLRQVRAGERDPTSADAGYHTDTSWRLVPTWGAVLRAKNLPPVGGDTIWVDAGAAYEGLPEEVKKRLEGLHVTHDFRPALNRVGLDYPIVAHPVVRNAPGDGGEDPLGQLHPADPHHWSLYRREPGAPAYRPHAVPEAWKYQVSRFLVAASFRCVLGTTGRRLVHYAVRN